MLAFCAVQFMQVLRIMNVRDQQKWVIEFKQFWEMNDSFGKQELGTDFGTDLEANSKQLRNFWGDKLIGFWRDIN